MSSSAARTHRRRGAGRGSQAPAGPGPNRATRDGAPDAALHVAQLQDSCVSRCWTHLGPFVVIACMHCMRVRGSTPACAPRSGPRWRLMRPQPPHKVRLMHPSPHRLNRQKTGPRRPSNAKSCPGAGTAATQEPGGRRGMSSHTPKGEGRVEWGRRAPARVPQQLARSWQGPGGGRRRWAPGMPAPRPPGGRLRVRQGHPPLRVQSGCRCLRRAAALPPRLPGTPRALAGTAS